MGFGDDKKQQTDLEDLNNEIAGRDVGRMARFLGDAIAADGETKREKEEREYRSLLDQMLQDAEYKRLYDDASSALDSAQSAMDHAVLENARAKERLERLVSELEERAATLDNGEKVFRAEDGSLYTASGRRLTTAESRDIVIPPNAPSYEQYRQAQDALNGVRERERDLADRQTRVLDRARDRLHDEDNPPSKDELRIITRDMEQATQDIRRSAAPDFSAATRGPSPQPDQPTIDVASLDQIPTL